MGLYSTFNTSDYYDDEPTTPTPTPQKPPVDTNPTIIKPITQEVKRSLYDQAKEVMTSKSEYKGPDFRDIYRVGQAVAIQGPNGEFRTRKGTIAEIVASTLMYVYMEDSYKDATDQWLTDFVTDKDTITPL